MCASHVILWKEGGHVEVPLSSDLAALVLAVAERLGVEPTCIDRLLRWEETVQEWILAEANELEPGDHIQAVLSGKPLLTRSSSSNVGKAVQQEPTARPLTKV